MSQFDDIKVGDQIAVFGRALGGSYALSGRRIHRSSVYRVTKTTFATEDGMTFSRASGEMRGDFGYHRPYAEPWSSEHEALLTKQRQANAVFNLRRRLASTPWMTIDEAVLNRVIAALDGGEASTTPP